MNKDGDEQETGGTAVSMTCCWRQAYQLRGGRPVTADFRLSSQSPPLLADFNDGKHAHLTKN